ncbi:uncharacterized protein TNCV_3021241 [Trichonephila clavipes]|nr:uncharacterized protein TNCV_3021241 [Trichonephila clavipes]
MINLVVLIAVLYDLLWFINVNQQNRKKWAFVIFILKEDETAQAIKEPDEIMHRDSESKYEKSDRHETPTLPSNIKAGYLNCKLHPYIPNPLRCFKCQRFGHSQNSCLGQLTCSRCAAVGHSSTDCTLEPKCINCSQIHTTDSKLCPKWKTEKEIQTIKTNRNISYFEAQKLIAPQFSQTYAQVAKPSIATSTTQTDENITKVKCPPLQILKPLLSVPHLNASPSITSNSTSSSTTQANLLPSESSIKPTTKIASRLPKPISSAAAPDNNLNTSASSLSAETRPLIRSNKSAAARRRAFN